MNKKFFSIAFLTLFLIGCAQNQTNNIPKINPEKDIKLLNNYGITKDNLLTDKNYYYFLNIEPNGISINKLNKQYHLINKKIFHILIEPTKALIKNEDLYILGYDNNKQKPILLIINLHNLKIEKKEYIGKKYSIPADFFIKDKNIFIAINVFDKNTQSDIYIYKNHSLLKKINSPKKEKAKYILPFNDKILIVGTITFTNNDILLMLIDKNAKIINAKSIDLGMDEYIKNVLIKNNKILLNIISTDYMGAEIDYIFELDKNLNLIKNKKNLEFKELPVKLRT
jgi:hypothetical protein